jgi:membrane-bound serine protease (ClpP class)
MLKTGKRACTYLFVLIILSTGFLFNSPAAGVHAAANDLVYVIPVKGDVTPAMSAYLSNQIQLANLAEAEGIIIDISTLGGLVQSALDMRDAIMESEIPVVVFVGNRAISAGALITIAADTIIMAPGSHIGSAEPIPYSEKAVAVISGEFRSTAEKRGRNAQVATGMVDKNIEVPGFPRGKLVDLTAEEAAEAGYAHAVLRNITEVLEYMGWDQAHVTEVEPDYKTRIAQFLTRYDISSILLTIAVIAMIIEILVQGFGLPGVISIIAFALYFGGGFLAGNTEWWSFLLFALGLALLFVEVFVPGFGIAGISGIVSLVLGIIFAAPTPMQGILNIGIALASAGILIPVLYKVLGGPRLFRRLVLQEAETVDKGYVSRADEAYSGLVGQTGEAVTPLRPSGIISIGGRKMDALSDGSFLPSGTRIRVIEAQGGRIVVTADE